MNILNRNVKISKERAEQAHGVVVCSKTGHRCSGNFISLSDLAFVFESSLLYPSQISGAVSLAEKYTRIWTMVSLSKNDPQGSSRM